MTPPPTLFGSLRRTRAFGNPVSRRALLGALLGVCATLAFYPERHRATTTLLVSEPGDDRRRVSADGHDRAGVQAVLRIARSGEVGRRVAREIGLGARPGVCDERSIRRWLDDRVGVRALPGGIVLIEAATRDGAYARRIVAAYLRATQRRLADVATETTGGPAFATVRLLESPSVDPARRYNTGPAAIGVLILLVGLGMEFYGWRPPVGEGRP